MTMLISLFLKQGIQQLHIYTTVKLQICTEMNCLDSPFWSMWAVLGQIKWQNSYFMIHKTWLGPFNPFFPPK